MALTLSEKISKELAEDIIAGKIAAGTRLDEVTLAERFKVSRSPVRDALRDLARTRMVEHQSRRGFSVTGIDAESIKDLFEALAEIEAICASLCAMRSSAMDRVRISKLARECEEIAQSGTYEDYIAFNDNFHHAIYAGAHNATLEGVAIELRQRLAPLRTGSFFQKSRIEHSKEEHRILVEALIRQDSQGAARAMREHAVQTALNVLEGLASNPHVKSAAA